MDQRALAYETPRREIADRVPAGARRVLDLGCAKGGLAGLLKARGPVEVVGVERDEDYAAAAEQHCDRVICADIEALTPDGLGRFDCLVAADVLEHLVDPWTALRAYARLLDPGGTAVISLPNVGHWSTYAALIKGSWPRTPEGVHDATHLRWFTLRDARELVEQAGLEVAFRGPPPATDLARLAARRPARPGGHTHPRRADARHLPARARRVSCARVTIFKAYDVRGLYGEQIDGDVAYEVARAFARVLGGGRIGLGRDMRLTAPELAARYREGLMAEGAHVVDAGMVGTEMLYWLVGSRELDGGLMCTASHNPKAYTGAKMVGRGAVPADIDEVRRTVEGLGEPPGGGSFEEVDIYEDFQRAALAFIDPSMVKPLKVVVDGGNGMAGPMVGPVLETLGLDLVTTYWVPDGEFPDHEPNPLLEENRRFIIDKVRAERADLGIAWDGDADRCFFIDDTGRFVDGDFLTALLAESVLEKQPGADILYDIRASRAVPDIVEEFGGRAHVNRVGHAFFKRRMRDEGGAFGGEVSGHYYFRDFYNADSGTIPALLILELLSHRGAKLSELLAPLRERYFISGEINSEVDDPPAKMDEVERRYGDGRITKLDGISIDYDDWHFNVRSSNTEPLLRLNLESLVSEQDMERRRDELLDLIRA